MFGSTMCQFAPLLNTILTTPHPHICKKDAPQNMPYNGGPYGIKVGQKQGISTENMAYDPPKWHTNPPFMPYEPHLLGVGVVFNLLIFWHYKHSGMAVGSLVYGSR